MVDRALADAAFLSRVEQTFDVEDLEENRITQWLVHAQKPDIGAVAQKTQRLATELSKPRDILEDTRDETDVGKLEDLRRKGKDVSVYKEVVVEKVTVRITEVITEEIETSTEVTELEKVEIKNIRGLKKAKTQKLGQLESRERAEVREKLIGEVASDRGVSEAEAEKIVTREKLVTEELGSPKYTF